MKNKIFSVSLICGLLFTSIPVGAITKEETVYSKLASDGSTKSITVSEHLINDGVETISDLTNLNDLKNVNGKEELKLDGNKLVIKSNGSDIYYQGTSESELPIKTSISYELDGKTITAKELIGKSGKVKITIDFENNDSHIVNGETLYTPFVVVSTLTLDSKNNSNITVSNGKVVSTGTKNLVAAISSPGLDKSLGLTKLNSLNKVEITFDTKKYESVSIYMVATPKVLESSDLDNLNKLDNLYNKVSELTNSSIKIQNGAKELALGTTKIAEASKLISTNLNTLSTYISSVKDGSIKLDEGIELLLNTINEKSASLANGNSKEQLQKIEYLINQNSTAIANLTASNSSLSAIYNNDQYPLFNEDGTPVIENGTPLTATLASFNNITIEYLAMALANPQIVTVKKQYESNQLLITLLTGNNVALQSCLTTFESTETTVKETLTSLTEALKTINDGSKKLVSGLTEISDGANALSEKTLEFVSGTESLVKGANTLSEGVNTFNDQGIQKINQFINGDLKNYQNKLESLVNLANKYESFTMKTDEMDGNTKFIMTVEKDKLEVKDSKVEEPKKETKSLWQKFLDIFK